MYACKWQHLTGRGRKIASRSRSAWPTKQVPGQTGLHNETLSPSQLTDPKVNRKKMEKLNALVAAVSGHELGNRASLMMASGCEQPASGRTTELENGNRSRSGPGEC